MTNTHPDINYTDKVVLAPMVRIGTLPMRLLALEYGADLVWSEELVDKRVIGSIRQYNKLTGTIDYVKGKSLTFSTHPSEKGKVILQLGTADADLALQAALTLKDDVAGVDLNCGCPKKFSIQGGMGAALLSDPDNLERILLKLVQYSGMPVSCKIRLLETQEDTIRLVKRIVATGVKALTVHCRTRDQRSTEKANWEALTEIVRVVKSISNIPVIVNGDVFEWKDIERVKKITNADSVMIARGAQLNASAFRKEGLLHFNEVVRAYIKKCIELQNLFQNTKYVILCMNTNDTSHSRSQLYANIQRTKSLKALCDLFDLADYYEKSQEIGIKNENDIKRDREEIDKCTEPSGKKAKTDANVGQESPH
ncbi:hypothetical protein BDB01DRAFT_846034 [Pilobolus umbonatus]|nr:hypothetical protein BDB01DRAFT_846034 [Pilobolus umbonatus]